MEQLLTDNDRRRMTEIITSTGNPRVKEAMRLRGRRGRAEGDYILVDGVREIGRALEAGVGIEEVFSCEPFLEGDEARGVLNRVVTSGARRTEVNERVFEKIRYGDRTGGLVAVARRPRRRLAELPASPNTLVAVVEALSKPGNLGGIIRSADAAGVGAVVVVAPETDVFGPNVIRASVGAVFHVPLVEASAQDAAAWLGGRDFRIVAASPDAKMLYTDVDFRGRVALVFGSEARGLSAQWRTPEVMRVRVPMLGKGDSLNVATTAALFFYEALRQRGAV